jgi:thioredoxin 1
MRFCVPSGTMETEKNTLRENRMLVVCLCAQWCATCRDYRVVFSQMATAFAHWHFVWLDIEDHAEVVDPVEVENFPTLLISQHGRPLFCGPITPQPETLRRLLTAHADGHSSVVVDAQRSALLIERIMAWLTPSES